VQGVRQVEITHRKNCLKGYISIATNTQNIDKQHQQTVNGSSFKSEADNVCKLFITK
jgi:hypothetical protein